MDEEKFSLSIYHFNLQYKAGDKKSYFNLHRSSMKPYLRFFSLFPQWKTSCEIQGHYLDFMARYFPEDLAQLRTLNNRGQLELVCVHYSDQIFLAYPERDLVESIKINNEIFEKYGLKRSNVWFGQENFFGQGLVKKIFPKFGFRTALLNWHYVWHHDKEYNKEKAPFWVFRDSDDTTGTKFNYLISSGQSFEDTANNFKISQKFSYWDDAELAFGATPYFSFLAKPKAQFLKHILKYKTLEKQGYKIATVTEYIDRCLELKLKPKMGPYFTEGSWNLRYYGGVYLWMGYYRLPFEKDGYIRSLTFRVRAKLLAIEKLIDNLIKKGVSIPKSVTIQLKLAWRHLLLAEVSDSTGQTPFPIEIQYSISECTDAERCISEIYSYLITIAPTEIPNSGFISTLTGQIFQDAPNYELPVMQVPIQELSQFGIEPWMIRIKRSKSRASLWKSNLPEGLKGTHYILNLEWRNKYTPFLNRVLAFFKNSEKYPKFTKVFDDHLGTYAGIKFPIKSNNIIYSPALMEDTIQEYPIDSFTYRTTWLPLPAGIIGLGNNHFLIKHNLHENTHIACTVNFEGQTPNIGFVTLNPPRNRRFRWKYSVLIDSNKEDALTLANLLNVFPTIPIESLRAIEPKKNLYYE